MIGPRRVGDVVAAAAALASLLLLWLQVPVTFDLRLASPQREQGLAWHVDLARFESKLFSVEGDTPDQPQRSSAQLLEDGKPLGPAHSMHDSIRQTGAGQFSHWQGGIYFSSSDGTDVATNGRRYSLRVGARPLPWPLVLVLAGSIGFLLARHRRSMSWLFAPRAPAPAPAAPAARVRLHSPPPWGLALLLLAILFTVFHQAHRSPDWEMLTTKHYWNSQSFHYGGYSDVFVATPQGPRAIQKESLVVYNNLFPFGETAGPALRKHQVAGWPSTERLAVPYAAYVVIVLTRGLVEVWNVFFLLNVAVWLSAIFFAYRLASIYFEDRYAPLFAALLVTFYPAFTLHFYAIKVAYINVAVLLGGIFVFEAGLRDRPGYLRFIVLSAVFFLGQFAVGAWLFLFVFLLVRLLSIPGPARLAHLLTLVLALVASLVALSYLRRAYSLPSVAQQVPTGLLEVLLRSFDWVNAWTRGEDVSGHKFLNHAGFAFFDNYLPLVIRAFVRGHWALMSLFVAAVTVLPAARKFALPSVLLAAAGHGGFVLTEWTFHYGYLSAPAAAVMILAVAGLLGRLLSRETSSGKVIAGLLLAAVLLGFMNQKLHAGLYYGGHADRYLPRIVIHPGESDETVEY